MTDPIRPPAPPGADPRELMRRPGVITLLSVLCGLAGGMLLLAGVALLLPGASLPASRAVGAGCIALGALDLATALGLFGLKRYGRTLLFVLACLGLAAVPIGTIITILLLIYITRPGVRVLFSGIEPSQLGGDQLAALQDVRKSGLGLALGVLLAVFGMIGGAGVVAAVAIPNFVSAVQRARQMRAAAELQALGQRLEDYARASGSYPAGQSVDDLARALGAGQTVAIPTTDPRGHAYLYFAWKTSAEAKGPDAYVVASAGMDGAWENTGDHGYERGVVTTFNGDIVFGNGQFVRAPAAVQSVTTGRP